MKNSTILRNYNLLKDSGHTEEEIIQIFKDKGVDLQGMRETGTLIPPSEMKEFSPTVDVPFVGELSKEDWENREKAQDKFTDYLVDVFREYGQGISFNSADELEAWLRSNTGGDTFEKELKTVQSKIKKFRESPENKDLNVMGMSPSTASQVAGGLTIPFSLTAKLLTKLPAIAPVAGEWVKNLFKRGLAGGITGGIEGYLYGVGESEGNIHDRLKSDKAIDYAKTGVVVGAPLGSAGGVADYGVNKLLSKGVDGNRKSLQSVISATKMDNMELSEFDELLDEIIKRGDTEISDIMTIADLAKPGGMVQRAAEVSTLASPSVMADATETLTKRAEKFPGIARGLIKKNLARRVPDPKSFKERISRFAKVIAQPFYDIADPKFVDLPQVATEINRLLQQKDDVGDMVRNAWKKMRFKMPQLVKKKMSKGIDAGEGRVPWGTDVPLSLPGEKAGGPVPIMQYDLFKRYLDQEIQKMTKTIKGDTLAKLDEGELMNLRNLINKELKAQSPEYTKAVGIWENAHKNSKAFDLGMNHHKDTKVASDMVRRAMNGFTDSQKQAYRMGYAYGMYNKVQNTNLSMANESKILRLFSEEEPEKLRYLFKTPEVAFDFIKKIKTIGDMDYLNKQILKGSPTFQRQQIEKLIRGEASPLTKTIDTIQSLRGAPRLAGDVSSALEDQAVKRQMQGMGGTLTAPGTENMRRGLRDLKAEEKRWANQRAGERQAPALLPTMLSPGYRDWDTPPKIYDYASDLTRSLLF